MKRSLSFLLVLCLLFGVTSLLGCPASSEGGGTTTTTKKSDTPAAPSEWADTLDTEAVRAEIGGKTLTVSVFEAYDYEIYAEEDSKDALDQLIYKRNKKIEERFGVTVTPDTTKMTGDSDHWSQYYYVRDELRSMAPEFDLVAMMAYVSGQLITQKYYRDFRASIPYVRESLAAEDPWWPVAMNRNSTVCGRQFVAVSDMCITLIDMSYAIILNETLEAQYKVAKQYGEACEEEWQTMYDIVESGAWTLDALMTVTKDFWVDNPDLGTPGRVDAEDVIGLYNAGHTELDNYTWACGFRYIENDGISEPTVFAVSSTFDTMVSTLRSFFEDNNGVTLGALGLTEDGRKESFASGHFLLMTGKLFFLKEPIIKGMAHNYGVLPYPKLNAEQGEYLTGTLDNITVLSVPRYTAGKQLKLTGALTVALSAETRRSVNETYYEMIIKHDSGFVNRAAVDMLDKIMEGRVFDLAIYHYEELKFDTVNSYGSLGLYLRYLVQERAGKSYTASGLWSSIGDVMQGKMRDLIRAYAEIK